MSAYNCENTILESVNSILNQTFSDFEFLIADDCSTDDTYKILKSINDPRIRLFQNEVNSHLVVTWNKLSKLVKADYITFQDADDISYPTRLEVLYKTITEDKEYALVGGNYFRPFKNWLQGIQSDFKLNYDEIKEDIEKYQIVNFYGTRSLFSKKVFDSLGGFRIYFDRIGWEDYDLFLRIVENYKVRNVSDVLYEYRYYSTSSSKLKKSNMTSTKIFINEIGFFLHKQRMKSNGVDGLMEGGNVTEFNEYLDYLDRVYLEDVSLPFRKIAKNQISNKDFKNAFQNILNAIRIDFLNKDNWFVFPKFAGALLRTMIKYMLIRTNLSRRDNRYNNLHL